VTQSASPWSALAVELDAWAAAGRIATFWWRDDDAVAPTAALDRLLRLADDIPLGLAVIPEPAEPSLAQALIGCPVTVLQHGITHANRAPPGARRSEFPEGRAVTPTLAALNIARVRMEALFGAGFLPVLVPPWNRIADDLAAALPEAGFIGLSASGIGVPGIHRATGINTLKNGVRPQQACPDQVRARRPFCVRRLDYSMTHPHCRRVDIQVDPIDWRRGQGFLGDGPVLAKLVDHLYRRRLGLVPDLPTGILTHHLLENRQVETFMSELKAMLAAHRAASWRSAAAIFRP